MPHGQKQRSVRTIRMTDYVNSSQAQVFDQPGEIIRVAYCRISRQGLISIRLVISAAVCNHVILLGERSELRIPKRPVAQRTMNEHNGFPFSELHVVELYPVADLHLLNCWQCTSCLSDSRRVPPQQPCNRTHDDKRL